MKNITILLFLLLCGLFTESYAQLNQSQVEDFFRRFTGRTEQIQNLFTPNLLTKVTPYQLATIRDDMENKYGKFVKVELLEGNNCKVYYEKAVFPCTIVFDHSGLVSTLWFGVPSFADDKIEQIRHELNALDGAVSVCVRKDGLDVFSIKKDLPMAIGSTFKLYVLKALLQKIHDGRLKWSDTLQIDVCHKSLRSGILQDWPLGHSVTIETAANLMISISDNTATDLLIDKVGREYIEQFAPSTMRPLYKTRELFILKLLKDENYIHRFIKAEMREKRLELESMDTINVCDLADISAFTAPRHIELEWYATTEELCKTIESLQNIPALSINAGFLKKDEWFYIAYKGGSEPGVLNYTFLVQKKDFSPMYSISATINNAQRNVDIDHEFTMLVKRIIDYFNTND